MTYDVELETGSDPCVASNSSRRKCHNDESGYIAQRNNPLVPGTHIVLYEAEAQGIDVADGGRYMIVCEAHGGANVQTTSRAVAYDSLKDSTAFCDGCRAVEDASRSPQQ